MYCIWASSTCALPSGWWRAGRRCRGSARCGRRRLDLDDLLGGVRLSRTEFAVADDGVGAGGRTIWRSSAPCRADVGGGSGLSRRWIMPSGTSEPAVSASAQARPGWRRHRRRSLRPPPPAQRVPAATAGTRPRRRRRVRSTNQPRGAAPAGLQGQFAEAGLGARSSQVRVGHSGLRSCHAGTTSRTSINVRPQRSATAGPFRPPAFGEVTASDQDRRSRRSWWCR